MQSNSRPELVLISCSRRKREHACAAGDLYISDRFAKARIYAEVTGRQWYVISAKWGLLHPDDIIAPYDMELAEQSSSYRAAWGNWVTAHLEQAEGPLLGRTVQIHASQVYSEPMLEPLDRLGAVVHQPLRGLVQGKQLTWYVAHTPEQPALARLGQKGDVQLSPRDRIVAALLEFDQSAQDREGDAGPPSFTPDVQANQLLFDDPFAFLLGVIFDQNYPAERAWQAPYELRKRLGHLDPARMMTEPEKVRSAISMQPALHRYVEKLPTWVVSAARIVTDTYAGDAANIWRDNPTAREVQQRLDAFPGIGQKKAAMGAECLVRNLGVGIQDLQGSDIAYDIHVRRVFLRTGLAQWDDLEHMLAIAREANPDRPGQIDLPAWMIGRSWCIAGVPICHSCPLTSVCPKKIDAAAMVRGV